MKSIEIHADAVKSPQNIYEYLREKELKKGDQVRYYVTGEKNVAMLIAIFLIAIVLHMEYNKKKRDSYTKQILDDLFSGAKSNEDIEKEIEEKYGIQIDAEIDSSFRNEWAKAAAYNLEKFYGEDEADYSDVEVKEPNPHYRKKKS